MSCVQKGSFGGRIDSPRGCRFVIRLGYSVTLASISTPKFEAIKKKEKFKNGGSSGGAAIIEGKIMNLSVEAKVAIAVATGFALMLVGAMAQG